MNQSQVDKKLEKTLLGQLIAEIGKFGGFDKKQASRLATVLLPYIDQYAATHTQQVREELIGKIKNLQRYDEGDGWDIAFGQSDQIKMGKDGKKKIVKKGKARSCCPGDDIAYVRDYTLDEVLTALNGGGENG